jgi:hypothetical protein
MGRKTPPVGAGAEGKTPSGVKPKESLIEYLKTAEPFNEDFPEIEDLPPEDVDVFDDFVVAPDDCDKES